MAAASATGMLAGTAPMNRSALREHRLHLPAIDDEIDHPFFEQELASLESLGQLLADRLLDDARAGEPDLRLRFGDVEVAQHRETRRHAAGGRIGQDRDVRQARSIQPRERAADLRHLHQRQRPLHHARSARGADNDCGQPPFQRPLDARA